MKDEMKKAFRHLPLAFPFVFLAFLCGRFKCVFLVHADSSNR